MSMPCEYVDVALTMQQAVREKKVPEPGLDPAPVIGQACGQPAAVVEHLPDGRAFRLCDLHTYRQLVNL